MDSYFITEGRDIINNEFGAEFHTYYSILQLIASGMNRRSDIDGALQKDTGVYLTNLEKNFGMLRRLRPLLSSPQSKTTSYEITDAFLRFWFRFICPYQSLIEIGQAQLLKDNIYKHYEQFSGKTLERYFQMLLLESGQYTKVGNWWDRKGENELDIVAINEFALTGVVAEVKRNEKKINLSTLKQKVGQLPLAQFGKYDLQLKGFSLNDM